MLSTLTPGLRRLETIEPQNHDPLISGLAGAQKFSATETGLTGHGQGVFGAKEFLEFFRLVRDDLEDDVTFNHG